MKKLLLLFAVLAVFVSCNKDDDPTPEPQISEIDKLPAATHTGVYVIALIVDGNVVDSKNFIKQ